MRWEDKRLRFKVRNAASAYGLKIGDPPFYEICFC